MGEGMSCCLDCNERSQLCHSTCKKYAEYKRKLNKINENRRSILEHERILNNYPRIRRKRK